ncbi:MAG: YfhO family protein [Elusimicrobiota bacterium]|nr:MAG: YfhO family protein [Elusimicrobiota bacterium]
MSVEVNAAGPGWLVLLDGWFPGWEATVDGKPAALLRADHAFRAVAVPAGRSAVRFDYRPRSVRLGLMLALFAANALVLLACGSSIARRLALRGR